jgi:glycosyltransferase involved in cell wall biosynthesis
MPNVVLESLACGTPVVATAVGGIGEVVTDRVAGRLMTERSVEALRSALAQLMDDLPTPSATAAFAARFAWGAVVERQIALYRRVGARPLPIGALGAPLQ